MRKQEANIKNLRKRILNRYIYAAGHDLLIGKDTLNIPAGWTDLVIETFDKIRSYHPGTRIAGMDINPPRYGFSIRFRFRFDIPAQSNPVNTPRFPRSLRWIEMQARKKALETCSTCGRQLGALRNKNRCAVCACKEGARHFDTPILPRQA